MITQMICTASENYRQSVWCVNEWNKNCGRTRTGQPFIVDAGRRGLFGGDIRSDALLHMFTREVRWRNGGQPLWRFT
jgi:hypothetical protein